MHVHGMAAQIWVHCNFVFKYLNGVGIRRWGASKGEIEREKGELTPKRDYGET